MDRTRVMATVAGLMLAFAAGTAAAQGTTEWRFFTYFPPNDKPAQLNRAFAEDVTKATNGKLKITVFAAGELPYKAPDVVKAVATGQVQMGDVAVGFASGDVPELNVLGLPFLCTSYDQFDKALPMVKPVADEVLQKKFGATVAIHWTMPPQNFWLVKPVTRLDEMKGLKVRAWNPEQVEMMRALGGSAVSITSAEVIPALERKVIDGAITSALSASDWRAFDIVKFGYMVNMTMGHQVMMVNSAELRKLPAGVRQTFLAKAAEWTAKYRQMSEQGDQSARQNLIANKVTLTEPSADDQRKAQQLMRPMWDQWAGKHGAIGKSLLAASIKACGR
ncbi:MAG: TRAP transporter substrate-binding protein DctP [Alphaproteobacteria bacterium]|nr:TRAP transporter substrate-binding protein DctP [Alphaproteobacteria bacterium]